MSLATGLSSAFAVLCLSGGVSLAQPATFFDVGSFEAPASPSSTKEYVGDTFGAFDFGGETVTVKWFRFALTAPISGDLFLDIDSRIYSGNDNFFALYDNAGNLVATDDTDGSFPEGVGAGLSFGSTGFRTPPDTPVLRGQDGPNLAAGTYWLALVAGPASAITVNPTNWDVATTSSFPVSFEDYFEMSFAVGNTTPLPPPMNDECQNALPVGESPVRGGEVWTGSNAGALHHAATPCYRNSPFPDLLPKEVWFLYTPTRTGRAIVTADGGAGGAATPILTRYDVCGGSALQCSGGGSFDFGEGVRILIDVVQGEPVLLSIGIRAGSTGPLSLGIDLLDPPCTLEVPTISAREPEPCDSDLNGGCNSVPAAYGVLRLNQPIVGTLFNTTSRRDTDWFEFTMPRAGRVELSLQAQLPAFAAILEPDNGNCFTPNLVAAQTGGYLDNTCIPVSATADLPAGVHRVAVAHLNFDGFACGEGYENYILSVRSDVGCAGDFNNDGQGDLFDYLDYAAAFASEDAAADFNTDGQVDVFDYLDFVAALSAC
ncbi:MAG: hypothetical protein SFZ23_00495 [Planctomycetota bacterium]|nr:hypothetical protein [Planctomycetota bacterium]